MNTSNNQLTLASVAAKIDAWREQKNTGDKIPDNIWHNIINISNNYPRGVLCSKLRITVSQLKNNSKRLNRYNEVYADPVELCQVPSITASTDITNNSSPGLISPLKTLVVEFTRPDGNVMKVHTTNESIAELIQTFFEVQLNAANNT